MPSSFLTVKFTADEGHIFITPPKVTVTPTNVNQYPQHGYTATKVNDTEYECRIAGINYVSDDAKIFVTGVTQDLNDTVHDVMVQNNITNSDVAILLNGEGAVSDNSIYAITKDSEIKVIVKALDEKVFFESPMLTIMVDNFKLESVSAEKISDGEYVFSIKNIPCDVKLIISGNTTIMKATIQNKMDSGIAQFTVVKGNADIDGNEITGLMPSGEYIIILKAETGKVFKKAPYVK